MLLKRTVSGIENVFETVWPWLKFGAELKIADDIVRLDVIQKYCWCKAKSIIKMKNLNVSNTNIVRNFQKVNTLVGSVFFFAFWGRLQTTKTLYFAKILHTSYHFTWNYCTTMAKCGNYRFENEHHGSYHIYQISVFESNQLKRIQFNEIL